MLELLRENPWLIIVILALLIPIFGIVFGTVTSYLTRTRQAELDASLKHEMLQRGMSAEEIRMVVEASPRGKHKNCSRESRMARAADEPREGALHS
jgi:hypothetical protein